MKIFGALPPLPFSGLFSWSPGGWKQVPPSESLYRISRLWSQVDRAYSPDYHRGHGPPAGER